MATAPLAPSRPFVYRTAKGTQWLIFVPETVLKRDLFSETRKGHFAGDDARADDPPHRLGSAVLVASDRLGCWPAARSPC